MQIKNDQYIRVVEVVPDSVLREEEHDDSAKILPSFHKAPLFSIDRI